MGFIDRLFSRVGNDLSPAASRPMPENVHDKDMVDGRFWGGEDALLAGGVTSATQAAEISAANFCLGIIGDTCGGVTVELVEKDHKRSEHELADILAFAPNPLQTGAEFWSAMVYNAALRGAAFAEPVVAPEGGIELWALDPLRQHVDWKDRSFSLTYQEEAGTARRLGPSELFWFAGLSDATLRPLTPWKMARGALDFALALEKHGRQTFLNGSRPSGVVEAPNLSDEQFDQMQGSIRGWKPGKTALLEGGAVYKPVQASNKDSELSALITQRTVELARYWRIPLSMVAEVSAGKANSEQQAQDFVKYTIRPQSRRIEQAVSRRLLTPDMRRAGIRVRLNLNALLRGDSATQWKNAVLARTASLMSIDELRGDWFDLPAYDEDWSRDPRAPLNSNRAADTMMGGETAPQDKVETEDA